APESPELRERQHVARSVRGAVDRDDAIERDRDDAAVVERDTGGDRVAHLGERRRAVDEDDPGAGIEQDEAGLVRDVRRINRDRDAAGRLDREVDLDPPGARRGEDGGALAGLEPERDQAGGYLVDARRHRMPADVLPRAALEGAVARPRAIAGGARAEHLGQVLRWAHRSPSARGLRLHSSASVRFRALRPTPLARAG